MLAAQTPPTNHRPFRGVYSSSALFLSQSLETALKYCNYVFTSTFVIEASLKLVAFGFRRFFKDRYEGGALGRFPVGLMVFVWLFLPSA